MDTQTCGTLIILNTEFIDCSPGLQCRLRGMKTGVVDRNY